MFEVMGNRLASHPLIPHMIAIQWWINNAKVRNFINFSTKM